MLAIEVIQQLRVRHSGALGHHAQRYLRDGALLDAALERREDIHFDCVMVDYCGHFRASGG